MTNILVLIDHSYNLIRIINCLGLLDPITGLIRFISKSSRQTAYVGITLLNSYRVPNYRHQASAPQSGSLFLLRPDLNNLLHLQLVHTLIFRTLPGILIDLTIFRTLLQTSIPIYTRRYPCTLSTVTKPICTEFIVRIVKHLLASSLYNLTKMPRSPIFQGFQDTLNC